jgi:hypothetical protein
LKRKGKEALDTPGVDIPFPTRSLVMPDCGSDEPDTTPKPIPAE